MRCHLFLLGYVPTCLHCCRHAECRMLTLIMAAFHLCVPDPGTGIVSAEPFVLLGHLHATEFMLLAAPVLFMF